MYFLMLPRTLLRHNDLTVNQITMLGILASRFKHKPKTSITVYALCDIYNMEPALVEDDLDVLFEKGFIDIGEDGSVTAVNLVDDEAA